MTVPQNTAVHLTVNDEVSSKTVKEGDTFALSVSQDVVINDYIVIPKGTKAVAEITWRTGKGAFGKSAKMEFAFKHLELGGRRIPIEGKHRQEGAGNTGATIGTAVAVGVFSAFVTGKSAVLQEGREFTAHTVDDFHVAIPTMTIPHIMASMPDAPTAQTSAPTAAAKQEIAIAQPLEPAISPAAQTKIVEESLSQ
ncbi:MAG: hypothetical protein WCY11_02435 [Novosphingobium sp.]